MRSNIFYTIIFSFGAGVLARSFFVLDTSHALFLLVVALACALLYRLKSNAEIFSLVALALLCASLGIVRMNISLEKTLLSEEMMEKEVQITGVVSEEPSVKDSRQRVEVRVEEIEGFSQVPEKVLVWTDAYPRYQYGDVLQVVGETVRPEDFETDTGRMFHYEAYLLKDSIHYQLFRPDITLVERGEGNPLKGFLYSVRRVYVESLNRVLPEPSSSLASGITVGVEDSLGDDIEKLLRRTGIIHIVVLSGFNITVVTDTLMRLASRFPLAVRSGVGIFAIILFALLTGASATIVRASIMAGLVILARFAGHGYDISRALALAGFIMVLHNPLILAFDPSFELSFLATLGLIYIAPILEEKLSFVNSKWFLEIVVATIAAQIAVLPFLLYEIGELSFVAMPVNLLVLPLIPFAMLISFVAGMFGLVSSVLALPFAGGAYVVLEYVFIAARFFGSLPGASVVIPPFPWWVMVFAYALMIMFIVRKRNKKKQIEKPTDR